MVRGNAKAKAQEKKAKRDAAQKASKKTNKGVTEKNRAAALKLTCEVCKTPISHKNLLRGHYESKHPKLPVPEVE